jgi:predicted phosphoribosyltransferase
VTFAIVLVCLAELEPFRAIGLHCEDFTQVSDEEVIAALDGYEPSTPA